MFHFPIELLSKMKKCVFVLFWLRNKCTRFRIFVNKTNDNVGSFTKQAIFMAWTWSVTFWTIWCPTSGHASNCETMQLHFCTAYNTRSTALSRILRFTLRCAFQVVVSMTLPKFADDGISKMKTFKVKKRSQVYFSHPYSILFLTLDRK